MSTTIKLDSLTKAFGPTRAVDGVTLTIDAGELFFLLGPSGCGKTTLLRMIAGFIEPTSGSITFDRLDPATGKQAWSREMTHVPPNKRNTGMVFQSYALWPHMTVAQNVAFGLNVRKTPTPERDQRVLEALAAVQMAEYSARKPNQLSGGQQQRIALARALVIRPDVLLLDEPLSNLDAKLRTELRSEIRRICKQSGITGVYVTHDQKEALSMADRIAIVSRGKVVQVGAPAELYRRPASRFVAEFLGETNFVPAQIVGREDGTITLQTAAGRLTSTRAAAGLSPEARDVVISLRPEAFHVNVRGLPNTLTARIGASMYLGETAQLAAELPGDIHIRVSRLNPDTQTGQGRNVGDQMTLSIDPDDVVVLPA